MGARMEKVTLARGFDLVDKHWSPTVVARVNDYELKVVKLEGEFIWHAHEETDELFLVLKGRLEIRTRDGGVVLEPGELAVVGMGVEHCPFAETEAEVLLLEPAGVSRTGDASVSTGSE